MSLLGVVFVVLLILKLVVPSMAEMSWWLVFAPILLIPVVVFVSVGAGALGIWLASIWKEWWK